MLKLHKKATHMKCTRFHDKSSFSSDLINLIPLIISTNDVQRKTLLLHLLPLTGHRQSPDKPIDVHYYLDLQFYQLETALNGSPLCQGILRDQSGESEPCKRIQTFITAIPCCGPETTLCKHFLQHQLEWLTNRRGRNGWHCKKPLLSGKTDIVWNLLESVVALPPDHHMSPHSVSSMWTLQHANRTEHCIPCNTCFPLPFPLRWSKQFKSWNIYTVIMTVYCT